MSLSPELGQPGAARRLSLPQVGRPVDQRAMDEVVERAYIVLLACPASIARRGLEAAMDYLATREEFMLLLESNVESALGRASTGAEDAPFEELMVDLMTAVQSRLDATPLLTVNS